MRKPAYVFFSTTCCFTLKKSEKLGNALKNQRNKLLSSLSLEFPINKKKSFLRDYKCMKDHFDFLIEACAPDVN